MLNYKEPRAEDVLEYLYEEIRHAPDAETCRKKVRVLIAILKDHKFDALREAVGAL